MSLISANDLLFKDYSWTSYRGDDPRLTGAPDSTLLNRHEGYEMLYFINKFCARHNWTPAPANKTTALKAERLIRQHLPTSIRSRAHVDQWLIENWRKYQ